MLFVFLAFGFAIFALSNTKKRKKRNFDADDFLDARGDEKQMSKLEGPNECQARVLSFWHALLRNTSYCVRIS